MHLENSSLVCQRARVAIRKCFAICALLGLVGCGPRKGSAENSGADETVGKTPATVQEATRVLDLSAIPLMKGAQAPDSRQVANFSYIASSEVKAAFEFHRQALLAQGWKELPRSTVSEQSASATFARDGFIVSLSVSRGEPGSVFVMLQNLGNIKPGQLPTPPGTKPVYVADSTAMYSAEAAVPATTDACRNVFLEKGWVPYGVAGDSAFFKKNAILATATVSSAPAQGGKATIQYLTQLISTDIPAPPGVEDLRYADQPPELTFETAGNQDAIIDFYRKNLATAGWQSTLDHTVAVDDKPTMIFRNPEKEMLTLSFFGAARGKKLGTSVRFQSAAEIAERDRKIKEQAPALLAAAKAKEEEEAARLAAAKVVPKVPVTLPADATVVKETKDSIKFTVPKGKAKAAAESLRAQFRDAGWKEKVASITGTSGTLLFSKEGQSLNLTYSDTGFLPTEVSLSAFRAELERR